MVRCTRSQSRYHIIIKDRFKATLGFPEGQTHSAWRRDRFSSLRLFYWIYWNWLNIVIDDTTPTIITLVPTNTELTVWKGNTDAHNSDRAVRRIFVDDVLFNTIEPSDKSYVIFPMIDLSNLFEFKILVEWCVQSQFAVNDNWVNENEKV